MIETRVAIVGGGPVGATAANLLGCYGVDALLIDRDRDIVGYPRAIGIDDESLRVFQAAGLAEEILSDAIQNVPLKFFDSSGRCFADVRPAAREFGWYRRNIFMQPLAEAVLRSGLKRFPQVRTRFGTEVTRLEQDEHGVTLHLLADGAPTTVRADYVIAADGGKSSVRSQLGIAMEGSTHPRKWVVIDCANDPVDAPYTALHCDPRRPYVCAHLPYDHRRWEFMLFPGEDEEQVLSPAKIRELLGRHLADPDVVDVVRARVYTHHARLAESFVKGRVALAGDAAHLMPPWAGQGMNTGIRDAANLAWKLAAVVKGQASPSLLATYEQERRQHAGAMIDLSVNLGRLLSPARASTARARDLLLRAASAVPGARSWIADMRFKPRPYYQRGFIVPETSRTAGAMFIQPTVEITGKRRVRLDDALGNWVSVVGFECDPLAQLDGAALAVVGRLGARVIKVVESRAGDAYHRAPNTRADTLVIEDADNELRGWFTAKGQNVVVLRPDRYVAALTTPQDLGRALTALAAHLGTVHRSNTRLSG
ncbi:MAG: bifunctional 3-(3-hydroxy-phenyl)propionate/3-hydroxycinnamic acid hydroxylase [Trebonia sp.]